ncbi:MAG: histidine kinase dimerization/phospho-acceptor domain-containing protein, partial [Chthoniobacterales bacterium]
SSLDRVRRPHPDFKYRSQFIAVRSGTVYGVGSSILALTFVILLLSKGKTEITFQAGAVFATSLVIIMLADLGSQNAAAARKGEAALRQSKEETQESLAAEQITRRELERANRAKDEFLATLSHELRTPLMAIMGWGQMLKAGKVSPEDMKQAAEAIERNSRLQVQLIEDLLDMNRIANGKLTLETKDVDLIYVVDAACNTVIHAAKAKGFISLRPLIEMWESCMAIPIAFSNAWGISSITR